MSVPCTKNDKRNNTTTHMNKYTHFYDEIEGKEYPVWDFGWNSAICGGAFVALCFILGIAVL